MSTVAVIYRSQQPDTRPPAYEAEIMRRLDAAVRVHQPGAEIVAVLRERRPHVPASWRIVLRSYDPRGHYHDQYARTVDGLACATGATADIVDHDSLYVPEHFAASEIPAGEFGFNPDYVSLTRRGWFERRNEAGVFAMRGPRELLLKHYTAARACLDAGNICVWDEPGFARYDTPQRKPVWFRQVCSGVNYFHTAILNVDLRDGANITGDYQAPSYRESFEPYGDWREMWRSLKREDFECGKS